MEEEVQKSLNLVKKVHASLYQDGGETSTDHTATFSLEEEPTSIRKQERPDSQSTMPTTLHKPRGSSMAITVPKEEEPIGPFVVSAREQTTEEASPEEI